MFNLQWSLKKVTNYLFFISYWLKVISIYWSQYIESLYTVICILIFICATLFQWNEGLWSGDYFVIVTWLNSLIKNRRIKHNNRDIGVSQCTELNMSKSFISLPYVSILGEILKRILCKHNIDTCFQSVRPLGSFLSSGKDLTRGDLVSGVQKIPCSCGKFYIMHNTPPPLFVEIKIY